MKVAESLPNPRSSNLNNSPTKMNSVDLRQHIDEAITAVIASSTLSNNSPTINKNQQQITSMSLGNPRLPNFADLPENLLETSTTPPMQTASSSTGAAQTSTSSYTIFTSSQQSDTPVLTSLTPVNVDLAGLLPLDNSRGSYALSNVAGTSGLSSDSAGFTQLFPMVPNNGSGNSLVSSGGGSLPGYLAVKVEPQEVVIGGTVVSSGTVSALMSPSQLNLGGTNVNSMNLTSLSSAGELLSLQPAAVYVQPSNQNGQVQFYKLDLGSICSTNADNSTNVQSLHKLNLPSNNRTVDLANNLIASMLQRQKRDVDDDSQVDDEGIMITNETVVVTSGEPGEILTDYNPNDMTRTNMLTSPAKSAGSTKKRARSLSSGGGGANTGDEEVDDIYIDTKDLCSRIAYELKAHSIPQAVFAERVLCRSQGTLSDLLRNPKPWNKLKSGRETFRRMYQWLKQPLCQRLESLEMFKAGGVNRQSTDSQDAYADEDLLSSSPEASPGPTMVATSSDVAEIQQKIISAAGKSSSSTNDVQTSPRQEPQPRLVKKPRLVFTDIQKRTLQAIFKETQRPSREMQQTIAEHLGLDLSTVQNFFMNARRRSRIDNPTSDSPAPYQQVRSITPPPMSPSSEDHQSDGHNVNNNSSLIITSSAGGGTTTTVFAKTVAKSRTSTATSSSANQQRSKQTSVTARNKQKTPTSTTTTYNVHSGNFGSNNATSSPYEIGTKIQLKIEPAVDYQTHKSHVKAVLIEATIPGGGSGKEMKMVS